MCLGEYFGNARVVLSTKTFRTDRTIRQLVVSVFQLTLYQTDGFPSREWKRGMRIKTQRRWHENQGLKMEEVLVPAEDSGRESRWEEGDQHVPYLETTCIFSLGMKADN